MITQKVAIQAIKAVTDAYAGGDWYIENKPPWYGVLKNPTPFREGCNDGQWAISSDTKTRKVMDWINIGSNEWEDWKRNLQAIPVTTKVNTDIKVFLGWKIAYKQYKNYLFDTIKKVCPTHIRFRSHSKGCPITAYAVENIGHYIPEINLQSIYFSAPNPGNQAFCDSHDKKCESLMIFINGDLVCCLPPWGKQIANVKGYWMWPPLLPWVHEPTNLLKCIENKKW